MRIVLNEKTGMGRHQDRTQAGIRMQRMWTTVPGIAPKNHRLQITMPMYSFECTQCGHRADKLLHVGERNEPIECSKCKDAGRESTMIRVVALTGEPRIQGGTPKHY
jgi:putative FmdB family regulatory protein